MHMNDRKTTHPTMNKRMPYAIYILNIGSIHIEDWKKPVILRVTATFGVETDPNCRVPTRLASEGDCHHIELTNK